MLRLPQRAMHTMQMQLPTAGRNQLRILPHGRQPCSSPVTQPPLMFASSHTLRHSLVHPYTRSTAPSSSAKQFSAGLSLPRRRQRTLVRPSTSFVTPLFAPARAPPSTSPATGSSSVSASFSRDATCSQPSPLVPPHPQGRRLAPQRPRPPSWSGGT
jgi:hypothetical protein